MVSPKGDALKEKNIYVAIADRRQMDWDIRFSFWILQGRIRHCGRDSFGNTVSSH